MHYYQDSNILSILSAYLYLLVTYSTTVCTAQMILIKGKNRNMHVVYVGLTIYKNVQSFGKISQDGGFACFYVHCSCHSFFLP